MKFFFFLVAEEWKSDEEQWDRERETKKENEREKKEKRKPYGYLNGKRENGGNFEFSWRFKNARIFRFVFLIPWKIKSLC